MKVLTVRFLTHPSLPNWFRNVRLFGRVKEGEDTRQFIIGYKKRLSCETKVVDGQLVAERNDKVWKIILSTPLFSIQFEK